MSTSTSGLTFAIFNVGPMWLGALIGALGSGLLLGWSFRLREEICARFATDDLLRAKGIAEIPSPEAHVDRLCRFRLPYLIPVPKKFAVWAFRGMLAARESD